MAITEASNAIAMIPLAQIRTDQNIRQELMDEEIDQLAQSIDLLGQLTPVSVRPDGDGYVLITGHKRYAAIAKLGNEGIRAEIRADDSSEQSERAAENIVRSQLNPCEEAMAVRAMLDRGLSEAGAAQALGWSKAHVTSRLRLVELPERAREMVGRGEIPLPAVEQLRAIGKVSPQLLELVIDYLADGNHFAAERLAREPGWVLDAALHGSERSVFAAYLSQVAAHEVEGLRLGKKTDALYERAVELSRKLDRYSYGADVRFSDSEIDQARASGVVIEFEYSRPVIVDRPLYRELCKQAIARTVTELEARLAEREQERKQSRHAQTGAHAEDPLADARREQQREQRELGRQAHGVNLDLGAALLNGLSTVDPADLDVARFFVYALLGSDHDGNPYTQVGEQVAHLAMCGIRLVIGEFRTDATISREYFLKVHKSSQLNPFKAST